MNRILIAIIVLLILGLMSMILSSFLVENDFSDKIAIIQITGPISTTAGGFSFREQAASSTAIVEFIEKAKDDKSVKGIILEINSPGGTVVASKEISRAVSSSEKPVVSWIREVGASGAYWIASASDYIIADSMSATGSIGVTASYLEFSKFFEEYGVTYQSLKSGRYKEASSPYKELTDEERELLQKKIDLIYDDFVDAVSVNRNLSNDKVKKLATGIFYLGSEALEFGLIDELGGKEEAVNKTKELAGIKDAKIVEYKEERTFFDVITQLSEEGAFAIGRGIGFELKPKVNRFELRA